jgi:hypothetical protein
MTDDADKSLPELRADALACHHSRSGYRGVSWDRARRKFRARIGTDGETNLGYFDSARAAARAYDEAARLRYRHPFLNFPRIGEKRVKRSSETLCPHGHRFAEHAYVTPGGWRYCKVCNRETGRRSRERRRLKR